MCRYLSIDLFMVNLIKLLVAETIERQITGLLVNNQLERIWKETVFSEFELHLRNLRGGTEEATKASLG
jgi:hypothetical protein